MNLNALSTQVMLAHSSAWLGEPTVRSALAPHPLGAAVLTEVDKVHKQLADKQNLRAHLAAAIARLTGELGLLDQFYDRKARSIYGHLGALAEGADDPELAAEYLGMQARLFPIGLDVVRRSYLDEAGAVVEAQNRMKPDMLERLASITVGPSTLADLCQDWIAAGTALGEKASERARLQASMGREGTAAQDIDARAARNLWIRTVLMFVETLSRIDITDELREKLLAPLERSVYEATRSRTGEPGEDAGGDIDGEPGNEPDAPVDDDLDDAIGTPTGETA